MSAGGRSGQYSDLVFSWEVLLGFSVLSFLSFGFRFRFRFRFSFVRSFVASFVASLLRCFVASLLRCFVASLLRCFVRCFVASLLRCFGVWRLDVRSLLRSFFASFVCWEKVGSSLLSLCLSSVVVSRCGHCAPQTLTPSRR